MNELLSDCSATPGAQGFIQAGLADITADQLVHFLMERPCFKELFFHDVGFVVGVCLTFKLNEFFYTGETPAMAEQF